MTIIERTVRWKLKINRTTISLRCARPTFIIIFMVGPNFVRRVMSATETKTKLYKLAI